MNYLKLFGAQHRFDPETAGCYILSDHQGTTKKDSSVAQQPNSGLGCLIIEVSRTHTCARTHALTMFKYSRFIKPIPVAGPSKA
jgi:tRNA pseudouridine-54 N-methylase